MNELYGLFIAQMLYKMKLNKVGEHVNEGEVIERVGNSDTTSETPLHIHHQRKDPRRTISPIFAEGLPLYFKSTDNKSMSEKN